MDWRITSIGLVLDGMSFLSPLGLAMLGFAWYSDESFALQAVLLTVGLSLALVGLIKRGPISVSYSGVLMLGCGFLLLLRVYAFGSLAMGSTPLPDRCAECRAPTSYTITNNVKLLDLP